MRLELCKNDKMYYQRNEGMSLALYQDIYIYNFTQNKCKA